MIDSVRFSIHGTHFAYIIVYHAEHAISLIERATTEYRASKKHLY